MFVMIDQFVDRTYLRQSSFFGTGCVAHVSMAHPIAPLLRRRLVAAAEAEGVPCRDGGTYICMEGPQFSSLAESLGYQAGGADVIGMTGATEAKLAREAEISYATVAMVTDYDCWHEEHGAVDVAAVIKVVADNAHRASAVVARVLREFPAEHEACPIGSDRSLDYAIITHACPSRSRTREKARRGRGTRAARRLSHDPRRPAARCLRGAREVGFKCGRRRRSLLRAARDR